MVFRCLDFLKVEENQQIFQKVRENFFDSFEAARVRQGSEDHRRALVMIDADRLYPIEAKLLEILPKACEDLGIPAFTPSKMEHQATWHGGGDYYRMHLDNGTPDTANRRLSYVYYFHQEPRSFGGGELAFQDWPETIEPINNLLVIFPSDWWHEVKPIQTTYRNPRYGRFTLNGWIRN